MKKDNNILIGTSLAILKKIYTHIKYLKRKKILKYLKYLKKKRIVFYLQSTNTHTHTYIEDIILRKHC